MNANRRNLLRYLSFGAVGAAAPAVVHAKTEEKKIVSDVEKDGPICTETLSIRNGTKMKPKEPTNDNALVFIGDNYTEHKQVAMSVGQDGNLWLKTENGIWKRVVTE